MEKHRHIHRESLERALVKQGVPDVERRLDQGIYGEHNEEVVRAWLETQRGPEPPPPRFTLDLAHLVPALSIKGIRRKPGKVITWTILVIVVIEIVSLVLAALVP